MAFFRKPRALSVHGEDLAAKYLRKQGYTILDRNVRLGRFEVDILAQEGDTVVFVEVKTRKSSWYAAPEDNVTPNKQRHLCNAARIYMGQHANPDTYYRFDVVSIVLPERGKPTITLFRDAFQER